MSAPPPFDARLAKLRHAMQEAGVGVFLCDHAEMLAWLTGYSISETFYRACIVPAEGEPVWVLRRIDEEPCRRATWLSRTETFADHEDLLALIAKIIAETGASHVGADFQSYGFTHHVFNRLTECLPDVTFRDMPRLSDLIRSVKDEGEIAAIRRAGEIGAGALDAVLAELALGDRPRDAAAIASAYYLKNGADDYWVGPISISRRAGGQGHDMGFLHATLDDDRLRQGDILHVELVPRCGLYSCRFMRSVSAGPPSEEDKAVMNRLAALQDRQFSAMRPGILAAEADAVLRDALLSEGLREDAPNITGYQTGLYARTPRSSDTSLAFHPGANWRLEENQVFHMYVTSKGLALSETVVICPEGAERLTTFRRDIPDFPA